VLVDTTIAGESGIPGPVHFEQESLFPFLSTTAHAKHYHWTPMKTKTKKTVRPRKGASQHRSRDTVARILSATWAILGIDGAKAVNTRSIAKRSKVTVGSIYQYFPNKETILFELLKQRLTNVMEELERVGTPEFLAMTALQWIDAYTKRFDTHGWNSVAQLELNKACRLDRALADLYDTHHQKVLGNFIHMFRHFFPRAEDDDLRVLARFVYGIEILEADVMRRETPAARPVVRQWRTHALTMLLAEMERKATLRGAKR